MQSVCLDPLMEINQLLPFVCPSIVFIIYVFLMHLFAVYLFFSMNASTYSHNISHCIYPTEGWNG